MITWRYASPAGRLRMAAGGVALVGGMAWLWLTGRPDGVLWLVAVVAMVELGTYFVVSLLARQSGVLAIDRVPAISAQTLARFFEHGFDPDLGWIRKPNTVKKDLGRYPYHIDRLGSRRNPGHEDLPAVIATYGDSNTFCREVEDHETWQWYLADQLGCNVLNFGVGGYGFDQALLRLRRDYHLAPTPVVLLTTAPITIARILSAWKHFSDFGNIMGFKPRFSLEGDELRLHANAIDTREKFFNLSQHVDHLQRVDHFYESSFLGEAFRFPYLMSALNNPRPFLLALAKGARRAGHPLPGFREWISGVIDDRLDECGPRRWVELHSDPAALRLLDRLVDEFMATSRQLGFWPMLAMLPMKGDVDYIRRHGHFYRSTVDRWRSRLNVVDATDLVLELGQHGPAYRDWYYTPAVNRSIGNLLADAFRERGPAMAGLMDSAPALDLRVSPSGANS